MPATVGTLLDSYWAALGVFPEAVKKRSTAVELRDQAVGALIKLGTGNLRLLVERLGGSPDPASPPHKLATDIVDGITENAIPYFKEFLRNRIPEVEEVFDAAFGGKTASIQADLDRLSKRPETLKALTKLVILLLERPAALTEVFYLALWRSRPTAFDYEITSKLPPKFVEKLIADAPKLAGALSRAISDRSVKPLGKLTLSDGTLVLAFNREYTPAIKRDFQHQYNLHYLCGLVVLGFDPARKVIDVRSANSRIGDAVREWLTNTYALKLRLLGNLVFDQYNPDEVMQAFLGGYKSGTGVELVAIRFRRTNLPGLASLSLTVKKYARSVREDVSRIKESGLVHTDSLTDIEAVAITFEDKEAEIPFEVSRTGALRLRYSNAGWPESLADNFRTAFEKTFGLPLNRRIDPTKLKGGRVGVIQYLLGIDNEEDVFPFQAQAFQELATRGLYTRTVEQVRGCRNAMCDRYGKPVTEAGRTDCVRCGKPLSERSVRRLRIDHRRALEEVRRAMSRANGWVLGKEERQFEKASFHPLRSPPAVLPRREVCVLVQDHLSSKIREKFIRSTQPLLVVKRRTDERHVHLDEHGTGVVSLAYLLAAEGDATLEAECDMLVRKVIDDLLRTNLQRTLQGAEQAFGVLRALPPGRKGYEYETDVFNLLKSIFPESIMLGREGYVEPDGYCTLPYYEGFSLRDGHGWCFMYDAKLSYAAGGYDLDIGEQRKMADYINRLRDSKVLRSQDKMIRAHVLVSNNMEESKVKAAYDFLMSDAGLKRRNRDIKLVMMRQEFLLRLYELRRGKEEDFIRREALLGKALIDRLDRPHPDGYTVLTVLDADAIAQDMLSQDPQYPTVDAEKLIQGS